MKYLLFFLLAVTTYSFSQENTAPKVVAIYPTADSIPVNILRFYIQFSKPMQEMNILQHIHLTNDNGKDMTGVFYENQYELWNENRTMVTLIVDPGRVKTGLLANNKMGKAFDEAQEYVLKVDSLLLDFENNTLSHSYSKKYVAIAEDKTAPNTELWQYSKPTKNTKEPINIAFQDCIDVISAHTYIKILNKKKEVYGKISLSKSGHNWSFTPEANWKKGAYEIIVHPALEDIAANSINQIFDHKLNDYKTEKHTQNLILQIE
jgi:hypothetical protein